MTRMILRFLNAPALILLTMLGIAVQSSFFTFWLLPYFQPDVILLAILWCALRRDFLEGGINTLILANICEIHSSSPRGLFLVTYMAIYLLVRLAARLLVIPDFNAYAWVTFFSVILAKSFSLVMLYLLGISTGQWDHFLLFMLLGAATTGLIGRWVFEWLERFDQKTFKNVRMDPDTEDELELELSGI